LGVYFGYTEAKPLGGLAQIFLEEDIRDVIACFTFGDDRFRGLASRVKFCHFTLTLTVVLTTLSHYRVSVWSTATLWVKK